MRFLARIIISVFINAVALEVAAHFVAGFELQNDVAGLFLAALILTALNLFLRPILRLLLSPLVLLTFGFAAIALNAFLLHLLDIWSPSITITGTLPLLYATIIVGVINAVLGFLERPFLHRN